MTQTIETAVKNKKEEIFRIKILTLIAKRMNLQPQAKKFSKIVLTMTRLKTNMKLKPPERCPKRMKKTT